MQQPEPPDSAEADALRDLVRSPGYRLVVERIHSEISRLQAELEQPQRIAQTAAIRGGLRALRVVLTVPDILIAEIGASQ